jgi:uncharacterized protein (DUF952 family)
MEERMPFVYQLIYETDWEVARSTGEVKPASLREEGYIHCFGSKEQLVRAANRFYPGQQDLMMLELDTALISSSLKHEPSRSGEIYPRIYGPLNVEAVARVQKMSLDVAGRLYLTCE